MVSEYYSGSNDDLFFHKVLILVVMEYGLGEQALFTVLKPLTNRCFQSPRPYRINIFGEVFNTSVKISLLQR